MMQVVLSSLFLNIFHFAPFLGDKIMLIIFGGVVSGLGAAIALKSGASTGGTDFIALWVSNHTGKTIWGVIFGFNCFILAIFGFMFGWDNAAYSIVFQFIFDQDHRQFLSSLRPRDAADHDAQGRRGHDRLC